MEVVSHAFPYDRSMMLSVLYDTLERLGLTIEQANSERGTVIVQSPGTPGQRIRIACSSLIMEGKTIVQLFCETGNDECDYIRRVLLDEMNSTIKRSLNQSRER